MKQTRQFFFCGIGGSGMLPLALILKDQGHEVAGSDRALDQGRTPEKFNELRARGIRLFPQDGSGLTDAAQTLVASAAIEDTVPDIAAANRRGIHRVTRAEALALLFNEAQMPIGIAGTSGKSTTTAMTAWILHAAGMAPTVMNGAVMINFITDDRPLASAVSGTGRPFISEIDESDGSIALFDPTIALLNNVAEDHKSMDDLRQLFGCFIAKADITVVNADNEEALNLSRQFAPSTHRTFSLNDERANLMARAIKPERFGVSFTVDNGSSRHQTTLSMPGHHNIANALGAMLAADAAGVPIEQSASLLETFKGVARRFDVIGERNGVLVIDDFAHNPDKIAATLKTLHEFEGRLLIMFQPHGYGPLKMMQAGFIQCFADNLHRDDYLVMPEPVYYGGTADRSVSSAAIVRGIRDAGRTADALADRNDCATELVAMAKPGDRIVIMGARDDTLPAFAADILSAL